MTNELERQNALAKDLLDTLREIEAIRNRLRNVAGVNRPDKPTREDSPAKPAVTTTADLLDILTRIEQQNLAILQGHPPRPSRKLLPVKEAAERLDRAPWTIRKLCSEKRIRGVRGEDGKWRIPADEVARLEETGVPKLAKR